MKLRFFSIFTIRFILILSLSLSLSVQLSWTSASAFAAKCMLELFTNIGVVWCMWFMAIINYLELIRRPTMTVCTFMFMLVASIGDRVIYTQRKGLFRVQDGLYTRKLVGQVFHVWQKSIRRRGNARSLRNERQRDRGFNNCASMCTMRCASETNQRRT